MPNSFLRVDVRAGGDQALGELGIAVVRGPDQRGRAVGGARVDVAAGFERGERRRAVAGLRGFEQRLLGRRTPRFRAEPTRERQTAAVMAQTSDNASALSPIDSTGISVRSSSVSNRFECRESCA